MYAATVSGRPLTFEVAGFWRRNMLMRDRETGSIWQQATGEAVAGPLQGSRLEPLGGQQTNWATWRGEHPETALAVEPEHAPKGIIALLPYRAMFDLFGRLRFTFPGLAVNDTRLPSREEVAGISIAGEACAYPLSILRRVGVVHDHLGGLPITVVYDHSGDRVRAFRRSAGDGEVTEPIAVMREWWLAWSEFHPGTSIYV